MTAQLSDNMAQPNYPRLANSFAPASGECVITLIQCASYLLIGIKISLILSTETTIRLCNKSLHLRIDLMYFKQT